MENVNDNIIDISTLNSNNYDKVITIEKENIDKLYEIRDYFFNVILNDYVKKELGERRIKRYYEKFDEDISGKRFFNYDKFIEQFERMKNNGFYEYIIKRYGEKGRLNIMISIYLDELGILLYLKDMEKIDEVDIKYLTEVHKKSLPIKNTKFMKNLANENVELSTNIREIYYERISDIYRIPEKNGVYVITYIMNNKKLKRYAGIAKNLSIRLQSHNRNKKKKSISYVDLYVIEDLDFSKSLEKVVIELVRPELNRIIPSLSIDDKILLKNIVTTNIIKDVVMDESLKDKIDEHINELDNKNTNIIDNNFLREKQENYNTNKNKDIDIKCSPLILSPRDKRDMLYNIDEWISVGNKCKKISEILYDIYVDLRNKYPSCIKGAKELHKAQYYFTLACYSMEKEMFAYIQKSCIENKKEYEKIFHPIVAFSKDF